MEWITKILEANPLSVALLVCVILALGLFWLIKNTRSIGENKQSGAGATLDLAALAERVSLLEHDMERLEKLEPRMDDLSEQLVEWRTVLQGLKESMNDKLDHFIRTVGERKS